MQRFEDMAQWGTTPTKMNFMEGLVKTPQVEISNPGYLNDYLRGSNSFGYGQETIATPDIAGKGGLEGLFKSWMGAGNFKDAFGGTNADGTKDTGYGGAVLGGLQSLASLWSGMKQYGLQKEQLAFAKDAFNKNYNNQVQTTNTQLEDRQKARVASNPNAYQSVGDYMAKNRLG
jgi:hypothetical protein